MATAHSYSPGIKGRVLLAPAACTNNLLAAVLVVQSGLLSLHQVQHSLGLALGKLERSRAPCFTANTLSSCISIIIEVCLACCTAMQMVAGREAQPPQSRSCQNILCQVRARPATSINC